jgi:hypothetical protein
MKNPQVSIIAMSLFSSQQLQMERQAKRGQTVLGDHATGGTPNLG